MECEPQWMQGTVSMLSFVVVLLWAMSAEFRATRDAKVLDCLLDQVLKHAHIMGEDPNGPELARLAKYLRVARLLGRMQRRRLKGLRRATPGATPGRRP